MTIHLNIRGCLFYVLLAFSSLCFCQSKQFQHLTSADGLSQSEVYAFLEDTQGFMWFGTVDGLNRYDGYDVTIYNINKDNPNSIPNNTIRCLAEDERGRIWIGTDAGLCVYDAKMEKIHQLRLNDQGEDVLSIRTVLINQGKLYVGTARGLFMVDVSSESLPSLDAAVHPVKRTYEPGSYQVVTSRLGGSGNAWFTTGTSLYRLSANQAGTAPELTLVSDLGGKLPDIRNLEEDSFGNLWVVSHNHGFVRLNPETGKLKYFRQGAANASVSSDKISSVAIDSTGNLWVGSHDSGLLFLKREALNDEVPVFQKVQHDPHTDRSLSSNLIFSLFVSKKNLLWIGTIGSGIDIYNPSRKQFQYYNLHNTDDPSSYGTNFIRSVYADEKDNLWVGTHNNGLFLYPRGEGKQAIKIGFGNEPVFHLNDAGGGDLLVCSGQGVSLVKSSNGRLVIKSTLAAGVTFYATKVYDGVFWIATLEGVKQCRIVNGKIIEEQAFSTRTTPALSFNNCRVLNYYRETRELFIGTEGGGLNVLRLDEELFDVENTVYMAEDSSNDFSNNYIRSIVRTADSEVWIGTYEGLNKMTTDLVAKTVVFKPYTQKNGLPNNTIQSIVEDNQNDLWIGTNQGLCRFDPTTESFSLYSLNDGLQSNEFSEHAIAKKGDGEIVIGGINGVNTFYPSQIVSGDFQPNTTLTYFYLFNKKVNVGEQDQDNGNIPLKKAIASTDSIFLEPTQNSFGFDFSAMVYNAPEKIQYAYKLEGFDEEWNMTDARNRKANYTNLEYGDYVFSVKASNDDGLWEATPKQVFISIKTPIYYTTAAFVLYGLLGLLGVFFWMNYSVLRYTTKNKLLLENQHNKKMRELEELRTRFFVNVSHDLRTPLTLISSPLEVALENKQIQPEVKSLLRLVARNVKKLREMTEQLLDIRKLESDDLVPKLKNLDVVAFVENEALFFQNVFQEKGIELAVESAEQQYTISFDPDMISKVIFNMLSNALKHTSEGKVSVSVSKAPDHVLAKQDAGNGFVKVSIKDTGVGIETADLPNVFDRFFQAKEQEHKGYGIGLSHSKDLIVAHYGEVEVTSEAGRGSVFSFYLPDVRIPVGEEGSVSPDEAETSVFPEIAVPVNSAESKPAEAVKEKCILLVEDNPDLRAFIGQELRKQYTVLEAEDGEQGLTMATENFPDLILSDVMMPNMDGMEFCRKIKSDLKTSHIPVILLTAKAGKEAKYAGLEIGADEYISKPFEMKYLRLKIRNLLKGRDRMRELFRASGSLEPAKVTVTSIDESFLASLMAEVEAGIADFDFSIKTLEHKMGMSHSSFYNKIKSLTGQSAKELVFSIRMKRARQVLEDTSNIRIAEVAYMVGFSDPKYFSKRFKEYFGASPSEVAKK